MVVQLGNAHSLLFSPLLSRISAAQDKRIGNSEVALRACWIMPVDCNDIDKIRFDTKSKE
jgi:hypothetical protein